MLVITKSKMAFPDGISGKEPICHAGTQEMWVRTLDQEASLEKEMASL